MITHTNDTMVNVKVLRWNLHKEEDRKLEPTTKKFSSNNTQPTMLYNSHSACTHHLTNQEYQDFHPVQDVKICQFRDEMQFKSQLTKEGNKICTYLVRRFVRVTGPNGEIMKGYESPSGMRFFYQLVTMLLAMIHMDICDCAMCIHLLAPLMVQTPKPKNQQVKKSPPLGLGWCTPSSIKKPTPAPSHYSSGWLSPSPPPVEWTIPVDQTQPLEYAPWTPNPKPQPSIKEINEESTQLIETICLYPDVKDEFMAGLPKKANHQDMKQAIWTWNKIHQAIEILDETFLNHESFAYTYINWVQYNQCCRDQAHYSPETECNTCTTKISYLQERFAEWVCLEGWDVASVWGQTA